MRLGLFYGWAWITWVILFAVTEGSALLTHHPQYTLSDYVWRLERLGQPWTALRYFLAAGLIWLLFHVVFGWWR